MSTFNPVIYWYTQGEDIPSVGLENTFPNGNAINANTCADNFSDDEIMLVLPPQKIAELSTSYTDHETASNDLETQLSNSIDYD